MMRRIGFWWLAAVAVVAILLVQQNGGWGAEASSSPEPGDNQLLMQTLLNLDRKYSAVARPSLRSGPATETEMGPKVQRAINMLRLQHLEKLYADRARPRFGKRTKLSHKYAAPPAVDYENQMSNSDMMNDWLPDRR